MSIHVCKCERHGRTEYHLRYPGMTQAEAQALADSINGSERVGPAHPLRKDAERYRWLRDTHGDVFEGDGPQGFLGPCAQIGFTFNGAHGASWGGHSDAEILDRAIDVAIAHEALQNAEVSGAGTASAGLTGWGPSDSD